MRRRPRNALLGRAALAAALALGCGASAAGGAPYTVTALGAGAAANQIVQFPLSDPGLLTTSVPVTGLAAGDTLVGIDYRPLDGALYGVAVNGNAVRLYTLAPATGVATPVADAVTVNAIAGATAFGVDFNPVADRIRVVDNLATDGGGGNANNFRLNPSNGALAGLDVDLGFSGLPGGNVNAPLTAVAYDRSVAGATASTAFAIAAGGDRLVRLGGVDGVPSPNGGVLGDVGPLGVDASVNAGLDVDGETGAGFALLEVGGVSRMYSVDLATGATLPTALDNRVGDGTLDFGSIALPPRGALAFANAAASVAEGDAATVSVVRTGRSDQTVTVRYATAHSGATTAAGTDVVPSSGTLTFPPGVSERSFAVQTVEDAADEPDETIELQLSGATDATLATDPLTSTLTIVDDDPAAGAGASPRAPVGLVSVPAQRIDRSLSATFSCTEACRATLTLRLGRRATLSRATATLARAGTRRVAFALSRREVRTLKRRARGPRSAQLRIAASFAGSGGTTRSSIRFALG